MMICKQHSTSTLLDAIYPLRSYIALAIYHHQQMNINQENYYKLGGLLNGHSFSCPSSIKHQVEQRLATLKLQPAAWIRLPIPGTRKGP